MTIKTLIFTCLILALYYSQSASGSSSIKGKYNGGIMFPSRGGQPGVFIPGSKVPGLINNNFYSPQKPSKSGKQLLEAAAPRKSVQNNYYGSSNDNDSDVASDEDVFESSYEYSDERTGNSGSDEHGNSEYTYEASDYSYEDSNDSDKYHQKPLLGKKTPLPIRPLNKPLSGSKFNTDPTASLLGGFKSKQVLDPTSSLLGGVKAKPVLDPTSSLLGGVKAKPVLDPTSSLLGGVKAKPTINPAANLLDPKFKPAEGPAASLLQAAAKPTAMPLAPQLGTYGKPSVPGATLLGAPIKTQPKGILDVANKSKPQKPKVQFQFQK